MPNFDDITLKHPIIMQAVGNWSYCGTLNQGANATSFSGDRDNRATYHISFGGLYYHVFVRNGLLVVSQYGLDITSVGSQPSKTSGTSLNVVSSARFHDGNLWVLGQTVSATGGVLALPAGFAVNVNPDPNWIDRTADLPSTIGSNSPNYFRKAVDAGFYYFLFTDFAAVTTTVMRASIATATTTGFTSISTTKIPNNNIIGYGVSPDGSVQMAAAQNGNCYRSLDGGVTWSLMAGLALSVNADFVYSKKFSRWVSCGGGIGPYSGGNQGLHYSNDNGGTWLTSKSLGNALDLQQVNSSLFTHIERLTADGSILLGISGEFPVQLWISLNGGREWAFLRAIQGPFSTPGNPQIAPVAVLNDGSRVMIFQTGLSGDESMFTSDMFGTPIYLTSSTDPKYWKP
jgi:hypothetical protein